MDIIIRYAPHPDQRIPIKLKKRIVHASREINFMIVYIENCVIV